MDDNYELVSVPQGLSWPNIPLAQVKQQIQENINNNLADLLLLMSREWLYITIISFIVTNV